MGRRLSERGGTLAPSASAGLPRLLTCGQRMEDKTEGQITKLKLVKRQMYGRAKTRTCWRRSGIVGAFMTGRAQMSLQATENAGTTAAVERFRTATQSATCAGWPQRPVKPGMTLGPYRPKTIRNPNPYLALAASCGRRPTFRY